MTIYSRKHSFAEQDAINKFEVLWEDLHEHEFWDRTVHKGYIAVPKILSLLGAYMDNLQKGQNLSSTYVGLWMNLWDLPFLEIGNEDLMALEAGFSGIGATKRWKERMRSLEKWGFIVSKKDQTPEFRFVLILHPHTVIEKLEQDANCKYEKETRTRLYEEMHLKENKYKGKGFYNQLLRNPPQSEGSGGNENGG